jgi:DNA-binding transcriptional LysR family regulator
MFELHQLEALVSIVEEGTVSKAAEQLLTSQPALSRTVQRFLYKDKRIYSH